MKKHLYLLLIAFLAIPAAVSAQQNLRSGYFLDGYIYKYKMNPAMAPERGFFAMPVLGNLGVGLETNLGLSTFLYPTENGKLTTFLSPRVSNQTFLDRIAESNKMNVNLDLGILAFGFRTGKCFHTVDLSLRTDSGMNMPGDFFRFMKLGGTLGRDAWDISNMGLRMSSRLEIAYGFSRSFLDDALRVGIRAKALLGVVRADIALDKMTLEMGAQRWAVDAHGTLHLSAPVSFMTKEESGNAQSPAQNNIVDWASINMDNMMADLMDPSLGFALDFGATYDFLKYFTASLSILDVGMMSWKHSMTAETPDTHWEFNGFESLKTDEISQQLNQMTQDLMGAVNFEMKDRATNHKTALAMTVNAGIEARMPFYERLTFGALYTQRIEGAYSWSEGRVAMGLAPVNWFSLSTNYAFSHFGHSWGGAVNLHLPGFGIFVGLDSFSPLLNVTPQFIPVDALNTNLAFGINFTFGKYHGRYPKKAKKVDDNE